MIKRENITPSVQILIIIGSAILAQLIGRYHAQSLILGRYFYLSWILLRIIFPIMVIWFVRIPVSAIGIGIPKIDKRTGLLLSSIVVLLVISFMVIYFYKGYVAYYSGSFSAGYGTLSRFSNFMIFTSSTLTGWEFLHRGFILMGISYILIEKEKVDEKRAYVLAISMAWIFEVLFHFIKPELEALGLLVGSPILSYLAIRTRSIWVPFFIHFLVEILFILVIILR